MNTCVMGEDWGAAHRESPMWGEWWKRVEGEGAWPRGVKLLAGKLYSEELFCVPESRADALVREFHTNVGHLGIKRMVRELRDRFLFPK